MARCPFAVQRILVENATQGKMTPRAVILHTAVDSATPNSSIYGYFSRGDVGVESHFYVMDNGTIEQYMDTEVRADANLDANAFAVSIETEDDGNPNQRPWTVEQVASIVKLVGWLCTTHNIPRQLIQSWNGSGIGWHSMWGAPSHWTPSAGKTCPGAPRILQVKGLIIPQLIAGEVENDMEQGDSVTFGRLGMTLKYSDWIGETWDGAQAAAAGVRRIEERLDQPTALAVDIDYDRIIDGVVAKLSALQFKADAA